MISFWRVRDFGWRALARHVCRLSVLFYEGGVKFKICSNATHCTEVIAGNLPSLLAQSAVRKFSNDYLAPHAAGSSIARARKQRCATHQAPGTTADAAKTS